MDKQYPAAAPDLVVQREFWNRWFIDILEREPDCTRLRHRDTVVRLLKALNLSRPNILEVGCANGWLSASLARFGQVTGVDLADKAIEVAQARYPHVKFVAGDFLSVELPSEYFDVVASVVVISYFADP